MKVIVDADSHAILGASILGVTGDEVVHGMLDVMAAGAPYDDQPCDAYPPDRVGLVPTLLDLHPVE